MNWQILPTLLPTLLLPLAAAVISACLALHTIRFRSVPGAAAFIWLMAAIAHWSAVFAMVSISPDLATKVVWAKAGYLGAVLVAPAWLGFALGTSGNSGWLSRRRIAALALLPALTLILVLTNETHGLIWTRVWLEQGLMQVSHGPGYWLFVAYSYACFFAGLALLINELKGSPRMFRFQAGAVMAGGILSWLANLWYITHPPGGFSQPQFIPLALLGTGMVFGWGMARHRLLELVPFAREAIVEHIRDAILVLDSAGRVVDANPAAQEFLASPGKDWTGQPAAGLLPEIPLADLSGAASASQPGAGRHAGREYEVRSWPLQPEKDQAHGRLVILRDMTERRKVEQAEREQRALAEALCDSAAALNSTLRLEEVLDRILANIGQVVEHDAASLMMVEEGLARIVRCRGYSTEHSLALTEQVILPVSGIPSLREMALSGRPRVVTDTRSDPNWVDLPSSGWVGSYAGAPVRIKGETVGFINLNSAQPGYYSQRHADRLGAFADQAAIALANAQLYGEVHQAALTDALTGAYNRRALFELGRREVERALRFHRPLSAVMIDIDHFKGVNDAIGHLAGDAVLRGLVSCVRANVREVDIVGRYGGDEFFFLLLENDAETACRVAERVRRSFEECFARSGQGTHCTVSIGVAEVGERTWDFEDLVDQVDKALYRAKQAGRNRVSG